MFEKLKRKLLRFRLFYELRKLNRLGNKSIYEIADHLERNEITGIRHNTLYCPLAIYLKQKLNVRVFIDNVGVEISSDDDNAFFIEPLPYNVRQFVLDVDAGIYSNLIKPVAGGMME